MNIATLAFAHVLFAAGSATTPPATPADFGTQNLLHNPDFTATPCYDLWQKQSADVICNVGPGTVWLNHNNTAADPAVSQVVSGLTVGTTYELVVGWRGGDHGPIHGVSGARPIFAIDLDGQEIQRLSTSADYTAWMINDKPVGDGFKTIAFTATATSHTLRFRGEVGADGDVLIDWVQLRPARKLTTIPITTGLQNQTIRCGTHRSNTNNFKYGFDFTASSPSAKAVKVEVYYGIETTGTQVFTLNGVIASASSGAPKLQNCPDVSPTVVTYTFPVSALVKSGANSFRGSSGGGAHGFSPNPAWDGAHARVVIEE